MTVAPGNERCFIIKIPENDRSHLSGSFDMLDDDLSASPLSVTVFNHKNEAVYHNRAGVPGGHFSLLDVYGRHDFCIGNGSGHYNAEHAFERTEEDNAHFLPYQDHHKDDDSVDGTNRDGKTRTVGFNIRVVEGATSRLQAHTKEELKGPAAEMLKEVTQLSMELSDQLESMLDHEEYMKDRENAHKHFIDLTVSLLFRWTMLEALALMVISIGQVLYFRKFFESRRYI
eukprot:CAMPEP_0197832070 /NCGR_PEP_ID=MMETSP1437-20131217/13153_1 /TAXON_ID=49252 ORGANISM="Eucampia antarctica, Strain CCMP1452" /NCGR_SAMPLE_ID=MMETSP1437 /ASSEMBLY_ACC=CAM_ASM_001096 /LENGTH=228 /DNA_ID=CAMNT_0043435251 /DNA_START=110 /DNA_END=796 /DNA_ORIENTATION=+